MKSFRLIRLPFLVAALASPAAALASGETVLPPDAPEAVRVPDGNEPYLAAHAVGTQNYVCLPSGSAQKWVLFTPQANLLTDGRKQILTHYFSPNPDENGVVRPTWLHSKDSSEVRGALFGSSADPAWVAPDAIPWLLIRVVGTEDGPTGGSTLSGTTFIQRVNTTGGREPLDGCTEASHVGERRYVPYTADYYFYAPAGN